MTEPWLQQVEIEKQHFVSGWLQKTCDLMQMKVACLSQPIRLGMATILLDLQLPMSSIASYEKI